MTLPGARNVTDVAVGVVIRQDRAVLLADRPAGKPYAGYWEFPGGKVEPGEDVAAALARELREELGISIVASLPWVTFEFDYPHAYVRLHFERVFEWNGTPHAREGQRLLFHRLDEPAPAPLLPAAVPALRWLALPDVLLLAAGACNLGPLLSRGQLAAASSRPRGDWIGAFAESREDLERAARLQCDFALVGPVGADRQWPDQTAIGWDGFARLSARTPLLLFAYGALRTDDVTNAQRRGAHGVAISLGAL
jgi:8-oxo-dGTP diphosphatase